MCSIVILLCVLQICVCRVMDYRVWIMYTDLLRATDGASESSVTH